MRWLKPGIPFAVTLKRHGKRIALEKLKADKEIPEGKWESSTTFSLMGVLNKWVGAFRPSDFGLCSPDEDLIWMTAYVSTVADMESYEKAEAEKQASLK